MNTPLAPKPEDLAESVAGEEDPGSAIDLALTGTPGSGQAICPECGGSGKLLAGRDCPMCQGTGKVNVGIGRA